MEKKEAIKLKKLENKIVRIYYLDRVIVGKLEIISENSNYSIIKIGYLLFSTEDSFSISDKKQTIVMKNVVINSPLTKNVRYCRQGYNFVDYQRKDSEKYMKLKEKL